MSERLFRAAVQYLEGSLLDIQLGDFLPSCQAGDIRVHYEVIVSLACSNYLRFQAVYAVYMRTN